MTENEYKIVAAFSKYALLIISLSSLYVLIRFTQLHILYFPEEIPYINHEGFVLISTVVICIISMKFKFRISMVIALVAILLGVINLVLFQTMSIMHYRELFLDKFI